MGGAELGVVYLAIRAKMDKLKGDFQKAYAEAGKETDTFSGKLAGAFSNPQVTMAIGMFATSIGAGLTKLGSDLQRAQSQLSAAASAAGISMQDLQSKTQGLDKKMENLAFTNAKTSDAERIFIEAGRPANEIMKDMAAAAELARAKHESLSTAATTLARVYAGYSRGVQEFLGKVTIGGVDAAKTQAEQAKAQDALTKAEENLTNLQARQGASAADAAAKTKLASEKAGLAAEKRQLSIQKMEESLKSVNLTEAQHQAVLDASAKAMDTVALSTTTSTASRVASSQELENAQARVTAAEQKAAAAQSGFGTSAKNNATAQATAAAEVAKANENLIQVQERLAAKATDTGNKQAAASAKAASATDAHGLAISNLKAKMEAAGVSAAIQQQIIAVTEQQAQLASTAVGGSQLKAVRNSQALQAALEKVQQAQDKVKESASGLKAGQITAGEAIDRLTTKLKGQDSAYVDSFMGKIEVLKTKFTDFAAKLGEKVGPAITALSPVLTGLFMLMESGALKGIASGVALAAGWVADMAGMAASSLAAGASMLLSLGWILIPIAAIVVAAVLLWKNWDKVWGFVKDILKTAWDFIKTHLDLIIAILALPLLPLFELIKRWRAVWGEMQDIIHTVASFISDRVDDIGNVFTGLWHIIENIWNKIKQIFQDIIGGVGSVLSAVNPLSGGFLGGILPSFAAGGMVPGAQGAARLVVAHGGEYIGKPGLDSGPSGGGGGGTVTNNFYTLDERTFNAAVRRANDANDRYNGKR